MKEVIIDKLHITSKICHKNYSFILIWGDDILNNRKQQVESFLDTVTSKEIQDYINNNKLNLEFIKKLKVVKETKPSSYLQKHVEKISRLANEAHNEVIDKFYKLGKAQIIAFILTCFYDDKYKINDIKYYLKAIIDDDNELKEYVYDIMKDF